MKGNEKLLKGTFVLFLALAICLIVAVIAAAAGPPTITEIYSPTHPDPDLWFANTSPEFGWTSSVSPAFTGSYNTPGYAYGVAVSGNYAYIADDSAGLQVIDVTNRSAPVLSGTFNTPGTAKDIAISGNHAYVADGDFGLQIIDVTNPASPSLTSTYNTPGKALGVAVAGNYAYVADNGGVGLQIIDISDPANPVLTGTYDTTGNAYGIAIAGNHAYIADGSSGLQVIDITNPAIPVKVGTYDTAGYAYDVSVAGGIACVADGIGGLQIIDISNPAAPVLKSTYNTPASSLGMASSGNYAYVADQASGLHIVDISDPVNPFLAGSYNTQGYAEDVVVVGNYAFVADYAAGLQIVSIGSQAGYSYVLDQEPSTLPDEISETVVPGASFSGVADGEWFFHVRAKDKAGLWGPAEHMKIKIETVDPVITGLQPTGTIYSGTTTISANYSDGISGIHTASVSMAVDGVTVSGCSVSAEQISCEASGLAAGTHSVSVRVFDNAGNLAVADGTFEVVTCGQEKPGLGLSRIGSYWASYSDYTARLLSVDFRITNVAGPHAANVTVMGTINSEEVILETVTPLQLGDIESGGEAGMTLKYTITVGLTQYDTTVYATAQNLCGDSFAYPGPFSGS